MSFDRRGIIKFIVGGAVGSLFTPVTWKLTDDASIWTQNWPWIPKNMDGATEYVATTSKLCPSNVGMLVRTVDGRPVTTKGDPDNPLSGGGITALAAAEAQLLYSPARLKAPLRRTADGALVRLSWGEAMAILEEKLGSVKGSGDKLAVLSGDENGSVNDVLSAFAAKMGSDNFFIMPGEVQPAATAASLMGAAGQFGYDLDGADVVVGVGADFLESWGPVAANRRAFAATHPHGHEPEAHYVAVTGMETNTATGCDQHVAVKPGTEAVFALGLANQLIQMGAASDAGDFGAFRGFVAAFTPEKVAQTCGVGAGVLKELAGRLAKADKPVVIGGSAFGQGAGAAPVMAAAACNLLLGTAAFTVVPDTPGVVSGAMSRAEASAKDFVGYLSDIHNGKAAVPEVLVVNEANPVYALPQATAMKKVLEKVGFTVAFSCFLDETAQMADLVMPVPMGLERLDDVANPYGFGGSLYALCVPTTEPVVQARLAGQVLIEAAARMGMALGVSSYEDVLKKKAAALGADFQALKKGGAATAKAPAAAGLALRPDVLAKAVAGAHDAAMPLTLAPVAKLNLGSGYVATPPANVQTIKETVLKGAMTCVHLNGATAAQAGVDEGDHVVVSSKGGQMDALVHIHEGVMDGVVAAYMGLGHTAFDQYTKGKGDNVSKLLTASFEPGTGLSSWTGTAVKLQKA